MRQGRPVSTAATEVEERPGEGDENARRRMLADVVAGLSRPQKELSPKYFYDARGSRLFEEITTLPEYYPTRIERALLRRWVPSWIEGVSPVSLVELGAGSASKTRILLDAMPARGSFVPVDVSEEFLHETAETLREEYPQLTVTPTVADLTHPLELSAPLSRPALFAFLGSTLGNFTPSGAVRLLGHVRATMHAEDAFLLGADLRPGHGKSRGEMEAAYNDSRGVTAEFNLNVLRVLNRELGSDFDLRGFAHRAVYDDAEARIEMHLVALRDHTVTIPGAETFRLHEGETIRTEISCKYDRETLGGLFAQAGLRITRWREDERGRYALVLGRASGE
jgi:L-histidine N-alpha-methyltransferase